MRYAATLFGRGLLIRSIVLICTLAPTADVASAATIAWGPAITQVNDSDVVNTGLTERAYTFVTSNTPTVNGVAFTPYETNANGDLETGLSTGSFNGYGGFTGQSTAYTALTTGSYYNYPAANYTFTFNNLNFGQNYLVQVWGIDARGNFGSRTMTIDGAVTLAYEPNGPAGGGPGQYVIGSFTADGASQTINFTTNDSGQINGIQLRAVPEPASAVLWALGTLGLCAAARRRRKS